MSATRAVTALLYYLYSDKSPHVRQGDKTDGERVIGDGDGHAEAVSGHEYLVLLFAVTL
jgi:hypothetical protein